MKEIKFRAWDKVSKMFRRVYEINYLWGFIYCELTENEITNSDRMSYEFSKYLYDGSYELLQYTGLKDKNGKEIYEGDIVKAFNFLNENEESVLIVVKYNTKDCGYNIIDFFGVSYEVIGNIYENPELLNKK